MESLGQLAGGVAHDFNNWLTVITGNLEILEAELTSPGAIDLLHEARAATERAGGLTRQLLAFSRRDVVEPKVLDVNEVVRSTMKLLEPLLGEDVTVVSRLDGKVGRVLADAGQIAQVLMNLAVNARDAMPSGGELALSTRRAVLARDAVPPGVAPGSFVVVEVRDSGVGIPAEVRPHLFEPFFTTKPMGRGTGLGLAVVHGIVVGAGGFVSVSSEVGAGAAFVLHLPEHARAAGEGEQPLARPGECVLVVEDEEAVRRIAARALASAGFEVLTAGSAEEALPLLEAGARIDVLFTDMSLPALSGAELAARARAGRPELRVLYASGFPGGSVVRQPSRTTEEFLPKPYTRTSLLRKVREVLDR